MASWNHFYSRVLHFAAFDVNLFVPPTVLYVDIAGNEVSLEYLLNWIEMNAELLSHQHMSPSIRAPKRYYI